MFSGGAVLNGLDARGDGKRLDTRQFTSSVRTSERRKVDPFFGTLTNRVTDLHKYLGTTAAAPVRKGRSNAGAIEDSTFSASRDLRSVRANAIKASDFNFGNRINSMIVQDIIDLMQVTTGGFDNMQVGHDARDSDITVAGPVGDINIKGNFLGSTRFRATGPNGTINNFSVGRSLFGILQATVDIGNITIGGDLGSSGVVGPPAFAGIDVGRDVRKLMVVGNVLSTASVQIDEDLNELIIGGDVEDGAVIRAGTIGKQDIGGGVFGSVVITG
jgi:hypothetical protein